jgi:hypothetical protein
MNDKLFTGSVRYSKLHSLEPINRNWAAIRSDQRIGERIAKAYVSAPAVDPAALQAYRTMREETWRQLDYLTGPLGIHVEVTPIDPYADARELHAELADGRMRVWSTAAGDNPHPFFTDDDNDAFRAVHDAFGHGSIGLGFDPHGEEAAWVKHSQMYSPLARQAMTTETRGQTCTFVYGNDGKFFSEQKAVLLPAEFWR